MKSPQKLSVFSRRGFQAGAVVLLVVTGLWLRIDWMNRSTLWCDEAESGINALTILERGIPFNEYLSLPVYENTLTEPWEDHPEYEFRDSSYSLQGLAVYHGWLPLYAIAASQALFGLQPDHVVTPPKVLHGVGEISARTVAARMPSVVFSGFCMVLIFFLARDLGGTAAGFAALALMAFNARTVDFGYQARYYSLTLLMTVFSAWCLLRVVRGGRWRDYLLLGFSGALLFHTHQFSALVFAGVAVVTLPGMVGRTGWFLKALAGGAVSVLLVFPWIWFSGFLTTASSVPKAWRLFDSWGDWLAYALDRPEQIVVLAALVLLLIVGKLKPAWMPGRITKIVGKHGKIYFVLLAWLVFGYAGFHLVVPAASFFYERLSLVLWVPYVLLLSLFVADFLESFFPRAAAVAGVGALLIFLAARDRLAFFENPSVGGAPGVLASVLGELEKIPFETGTRFYATPNEHLTYTYYSGLPVQSVAPVRKSFFADCQKPVVFIESQMESMLPAAEDVLMASVPVGKRLSQGQAQEFREQVWTVLAWRELESRGIPVPPRQPLPDWLDFMVEKSRFDQLVFRKKFQDDIKSSPIFRKIPAEQTKDFWLGFFYRFVGPEERIGRQQNIFPLLQRAEIRLLPAANVVIYLYRPGVEGNRQGEGRVLPGIISD